MISSGCIPDRFFSYANPTSPECWRTIRGPTFRSTVVVQGEVTPRTWCCRDWAQAGQVAGDIISGGGGHFPWIHGFRFRTRMLKTGQANAGGSHHPVQATTGSRQHIAGCQRQSPLATATPVLLLPGRDSPLSLLLPTR